MYPRILSRKGKGTISNEGNTTHVNVQIGIDDSRHAYTFWKTIRFEHWAWIFLFLNLQQLFSRGDSITGLDPQSGYRIITVVIATIIIFVGLFQQSRIMRHLFTAPVIWFFIYAIIAIISSMYASVTLYSLWKALEMAVSACAISLIVGTYGLRRGAISVYELTLVMIGIVALTPWMWMIISPGEVWNPASRGIFPMLQGVVPPINSNTLGLLSAIIGLASFVRVVRDIRSNKIFVFIAIMAFITLILSSSRTNIAGFFVGLIIFSYFDRRRKLFISIAAILVLVLTVGVARDLATTYLQRGSHIESIKTLSGRTNVWAKAYEYFKESPLIGHGFASAGRFDILHNKSSHLHNAFIEALVGVGLLGLAPWSLMIIWTGYRLWHPKNISITQLSQQYRSIRAELLGMYVLLLIRAITSSGLSAHNMETMLFLTLTTMTQFSWDTDTPERK